VLRRAPFFITMNIDRAINEILVGRRIIKTGSEKYPTLMFRGLVGIEKIYADLIYDEAYEEAILDGLPTEDELKKSLLETGLWGYKQETLLIKASELINQLRLKLPSLKYKVAELNATRRRIDKATAQKKELDSVKLSIMNNCADRYALEQKTWWHMHKVVYWVDGTPIWTSHEEFCSLDADDANEVISAYLEGFNFPTMDIRKIARSPQWRIYFTTCESSGDLFGRPLCDLDFNQVNLLYWSVVYDNALSSYEPPSNATIDDDELFDSWSDAQRKKREKDLARNRVPTKQKSAPRGGSVLTEDFVFADEEGARLLQSEVLND